MPSAVAIRSRPRASDSRLVERGAQGPGAGEDADAAAGGVDDRRDPVAAVVQQAEGPLGIGAGRQRQQLRGHHLAELGEPVDAGAVGLGDDADRPAVVVDDDDGAVRPLGQQAERVPGGRGRVERERRVVDQVARLHPGDDLGDDIDRYVLRQHRDAAAPGDRLGHPAAGDGGHVGHDDRDGRAAAVPRGQVDIEAGTDLRTGWARGRRRCRSGHALAR